MADVLSKSDLDALAGWHLGYGRDEADWDDEQTAVIDEMVRMACRRVYVTEPDAQYGVPAGYRWTFLKPILTVRTVSGEQYIELPDDFGGLEGPITVAQSGQSGFSPLPQMSEPQLRQLYAERPDVTGRPQAVAVDVLAGEGLSHGSRSRMMVYPEPDDTYTLQVRYYLTPEAISGGRPYPYGGAQHAELFKAAVLACCDLEVNGIVAERHDYFMKRLKASIEVDQRNNAQTLGYVGDGSDLRFRRQQDGLVMVNGVSYP